MPKKDKKEKAEVSRSNRRTSPTVTLKQNGHVHGKLYYAGDTVMVTQAEKDYLLKTAPEVFSN